MVLRSFLLTDVWLLFFLSLFWFACYSRGLYWSRVRWFFGAFIENSSRNVFQSMFLLAGILLCSQRIDHESSSIGQENLP